LLAVSAEKPSVRWCTFLQSTVAGGTALVERRFRDGIRAGDTPRDFPVAVRAEEAAELVLQPRRV